MKRLIFSLVLPIMAMCGAMAQNNAMYIYRNDGEFNAFLKADIDSIAQSHYDADSIYHADWQMQVIYTQDSIYKIPLAAIDSVSFVAPETIINEKVFELTAAHDPYLSECDTVRFTLSQNTPAEKQPSKGNIVVSTYDCLSFPDGIMARIVSKTQDDAGIHYNCEKVGLEDVYDQLVFIGEGYLEESTESPQAREPRKVQATYEHVLWNKNWNKTIVKGGTSTTLSVDDAAKATITVNIQIGKPMYFRLDLQNDLNTSISFEAKKSFEKYNEQQIAKVTFPRIRIPQCPLLFITPKLTLSGYFAEGAEVTLNCDVHYNRTDKVSFILQNKQWSVHHASANKAGIDVTTLSMTGYAEIGLIPDLFFSFCGSATGLGIETSVGLKESADFKFDAVATFDEGMYSALNNSYARTTMPWSVRAYAQIGLFGDDIQPASYKVSREPQIGTDKYLLPAFSEIEFYSEDTTAVLKTQPSRDLLLPVQLGMSFYEKDEKLDTKYLYPTYLNEKQWEIYWDNGVQVAYNMKAGKTYTAYPMVKIMGKELRAVPSKDFRLSCPDNHHPHAIDLGLPSGTKWSCCNVGANDPAGFGGFYAWGETSAKNYFGYRNYAYYNYDTNSVDFIGSDIAGTTYDVAYVCMGNPWRMPSIAQYQELINNCSQKWIRKSFRNGILVTGPNGAQIFFPAYGYMNDGTTYYNDSYGEYWTSTFSPNYESWACHLHFNDFYWTIYKYDAPRSSGRTVRAVCP